MDGRVAKRYARALFNAAAEGKVIDAVEADLEAITTLAQSNNEFAEFLSSPKMAREDKQKVFDNLFADRATALTARVMRLMLSKRREAEIVGLRDEFVRLRREQGQVLYAHVTSATPLDEGQKKMLSEKLAAKSGKRVESEYFVDPKLIGGVRVALGNYVLDGSIKGSLGRMRDSLRRDLLKQG